MSINDEWRTPDWLFDKLNKEYGPFDIDLCATDGNSKCLGYCSNYLEDKAYLKDAWP